MPDLDTDVLEAICGLIDDIHDLLSVSLTCSVVGRIAIRQLLRTHTIHLTSRKAIRDFRSFILNQKPTRAHHIHSLVIPEIAWMSEYNILFDEVHHLMDILDCAVNLDSLDMSLPNYRAESARISLAFAGMSALRYLSLADPGPYWAHHALSALKSPLRTLCVGGGDKLTFAPSSAAGRFFQMFSRFSSSSTLTTLHLDQIPIYDNSFLDFPQFRSIRSLTITKPLPREPKLNALLHLFPSLDGTLCLRLDFSAGMRLFNNFRLSEIQEENRRAQDVSQWTGLDRLDCDASAAGILALRCPVRHFTIDSFDLPAIIGIQPQNLVIAPIRLPFYLSSLGRFRSKTPAAGSYPTHIVLIASWESKEYVNARVLFEEPYSFRWDIAFEALLQTISRFKNVTHARLVFYCHRDGPHEHEMEDFIHEMRERASVSQLAPPLQLLAPCPKLRYFSVTSAGRDDTQSSRRRWIHAGAWRVVHPGEGGLLGDGSGSELALPMLEALSDYAARRVIEAEDLGLPEEWERKLAACRM
ncbi:hypothetical protein LXA43DRAFT_952931 [Ganoderma leucocontextum]|nr:hypothetical protein LXA43DRAFT_952931 [Ganoderma leucocontextum]